MVSMYVVAVSGLLGLVAFWLCSLRWSPNLPPSLPTLPFLGILPHFPVTHLKLDAWSRQLGPIFTLPLPGLVVRRHVVVLASAEVASAVLDKQSSRSSSRPRLIMGSTLMMHDLNMLLTPYGDTWKRRRRAAAEIVSPLSQSAVRAVQTTEARLLCSSLLRDNSPTPDVVGHCQRSAMSTVRRVLYGGEPLGLADGAVAEAEAKAVRTTDDLLMRGFEAVKPPGPLVDIFPVLLYLPKALAPFKRYADWFFEYADSFYISLAQEALRRRALTTEADMTNVTAAMFEKREKLGLTEQEIAWVSSSLLLGGYATTSTTLQWLIIALVLHPEVVQEAHTQLESVLNGAMPTLEDRERLPYIGAIVKEVLRWRPTSAMGGPHQVTEDIHYDGYVIPRDTVILFNLWSICRDSTLFPSDPSSFRPSRFLSPSGQPHPHNPALGRTDDLGFGYGRRICPGKEVALGSLFIDAAMLIWAFEFRVRREGNVGMRDDEYLNTGPTISPVPVPFEVRPRSQAVVDYLKEHVGQPVQIP